MSDVEGASTARDAQRIGDVERDAATQALNAHREAGRLDATEYEDRQVRVTRARTWAEIQPIFADLPDPHPAGMPPAGTLRPLAQPMADGTVAPVVQAPVEGRGVIGGLVPDHYRTTIMALTPFAAVLLFFITGTWLWFLAIPIMGIVLFGADGNEERKRRERRDREERRRVEREQRRIDRERRRNY